LSYVPAVMVGIFLFALWYLIHQQTLEHRASKLKGGDVNEKLLDFTIDNYYHTISCYCYSINTVFVAKFFF